MPAKPLNARQREDAARLRALYRAWRDRIAKAQGRRPSQEEAAATLGFGQSALSQYLLGRIPLNLESAVRFAQLLGCSVSEFSPTLADRLVACAQAAGSAVARAPEAPKLTTRSALELIAERMKSLSEGERKAVGNLVAGLGPRPSASRFLAAIIALLEG